MIKDGKILLGKGDNEVYMFPRMANRHGLIAGATGTGKTVTLKVLAEAFSDLGVPVFVADIKGDLAGTCKKGEYNDNIASRVENLGLEGFANKAYPVRFFDVFGEKGHPVRATVSDMGPTLLARLMNLTEVQEGVLNIVFHIADDNNLLLVDLKDLRAMLSYVGENAKAFTVDYGNITKQSVGAIQRALLLLEDEGGDKFFGEPMMEMSDLLACEEDKGIISIMHCVKLAQSPRVYSTFLLWMLSELFENLPEEGDLEKPKMVFFFDEAHMLFDEAPKELIQKVEQTVRLIRSKGVGVYFVTQNPMDVPDSVLAQLNNRIQHSLRAYTPAELKNVKAAAQSFRANPAFDTETVITELKTGEALVSCLQEDGRPAIVEKATICPPQSYMGAIDDERRTILIESSDLFGKYEDAVDRTSAYEVIKENATKAEEVEEEVVEEATEKKATTKKAAAKKETAKKDTKKSSSKRGVVERAATNAMSTLTRETAKDLFDSMILGKDTSKRQSSMEKATKSALRTLSGEVGKQLSRGLFGVLKK